MHYNKKTKYNEGYTQRERLSYNFNICETLGKPDKCPIHSKSTQKELISILNVCSNQYLTVKTRRCN